MWNYVDVRNGMVFGAWMNNTCVLCGYECLGRCYVVSIDIAADYPAPKEKLME